MISNSAIGAVVGCCKPRWQFSPLGDFGVKRPALSRGVVTRVTPKGGVSPHKRGSAPIKTKNAAWAAFFAVT